MSLDVTLVSPNGEVLYDANITHNLTRMASEAGIYEAIWRPEMCGIEKAGDVYLACKDGLWDLIMCPDHFRQFDPSNGWGDYDGFVAWVIDYMRACRDSPYALIEISR